MSAASVPGIIAALSMKPISPMLAQSLASACRSVAEASQAAASEPAAPPAGAPATGGSLDLRA